MTEDRENAKQIRGPLSRSKGTPEMIKRLEIFLYTGTDRAL